MTEPQEHRSIDELFRDAFDHLPDTPAESGWDTPSEHVWKNVQQQIAAPRSGPGLQTTLLIGAAALIVALALMYTFRPVKPAVESPATGTQVNVPAAAPVTIPSEPQTVIATEPQPTRVTPSSTAGSKPVPLQRRENRPAPESPVHVNHQGDVVRAGGATQLPDARPATGTAPNTTEQLRNTHAREVEQLWKTPVNTLPVPRTSKGSN